MRAIVRRDSGEGYRDMLRRLARESGIETPTADDLVRLDRKRSGKKLSNEDWQSKSDPDARIAKMKDGRTRLAYKPEHAVDQAPNVESPTELVTDKGYHSRDGLKDLPDSEWKTRLAEPKPAGILRWKGDDDAKRAYDNNRARLLFSGFALWFSFLSLAGYKARLKDEDAVRFDAARALTAPKPWNVYLQTLETALNTLTSWMGKRVRLMPENGDRGDWGKSVNWCFTLAIIYPFVFLLTSWMFGGTGTVGEVEFLPTPESLPDWRRALLVVFLLLMGAGFFFLGRNLDRIDEVANAWLDRNLWQRFPSAHRRKGSCPRAWCTS